MLDRLCHQDCRSEVCLVSEDAPNYKKFIEQGRPLILCSFGNVDLTQEIHTFMAE